MVLLVECIATGLGLLQGLLILLNLRSNWIVYVLQMIFMLIISKINCLWGDCINNTIYIVMGIIGWFLWNKKAKNISTLTIRQHLSYLVLCIIGVFCTWIILSKCHQIFTFLNKDTIPFSDALTTVTALFATWLMVQRKLECWIWWAFNDVFYVIQFSILDGNHLPIIILNGIWTIMAVISYFNWKKEMVK